MVLDSKYSWSNRKIDLQPDICIKICYNQNIQVHMNEQLEKGEWFIISSLRGGRNKGFIKSYWPTLEVINELRF